MYRRPIIVVILISFFLITPGAFSRALPGSHPEPDSLRSVALHFRFDRSLLEKGYMDNDSAFDLLRKILTDSTALSRLDSITIRASASPDGSADYNLRLARARAASVRSYLLWQYPYLAQTKIRLYPTSEHWQGLYRMVEADPNVPCREEVLQILGEETTPAIKNARLRQAGNGAAFAYIGKHLLHRLRTGVVGMTFHRQPELQPNPISDSNETEDEEFIKETQTSTAAPGVSEGVPRNDMPSPGTAPTQEGYIRPLALKTNLLYDLASVLNAEAEIPLGRRFSIAGEVIFPWWLWERKQHCLEVFSGGVEGRYWFRPNYKRQRTSLGTHNPLTGWFAGIYGSVGLYDLEWDRSGYQGEFFSAGATIGYAHPLSQAFNLEFSLGAGYMRSGYRHYQARQDLLGTWHLIRQYPGSWSWFGPTKAKIALVWYPHFKSGKNGGPKR